MESQFIVTENWLKQERAFESILTTFKKYFSSDGEEILDVLNFYLKLGNIKDIGWICSRIPNFPKGFDIPTLELVNKLIELKQYGIAKNLTSRLPFNENSLELDNLNNSLFYNGDVYVKGNVNNPLAIFIQGNLKVNGKFLSLNTGDADDIPIIDARRISAHQLNAINSNIYCRSVEANIIYLRNSSITGNIKTNLIDIMDDSIIWGKIEAGSKVFNDNSRIYGNVYTENIVSVNDGEINGEIITFKQYPKF